MVTPEFPLNCGGIGYYVYYLSRELVKMGHDVLVILRGKVDRSYYYENIRTREIKVAGHPPLNQLIFKRKLKRILSEEGTDLVHVHYGAMPFIKCDYPLIVTAHWCNKEGIPIFYRPIKDIDALYRNIMLPFYIHVERKLLLSCDKLTVVSNSLRNEFKKHYKVDSDVIYNGVDYEKFNENSTLKEDIILFTGKFRFGKGLLDLLDIAEMLKRSHPKVSVVMVGNGPIKNKIQEHIQTRDLFNVKTVNHLSHSELLEYYHKSRIYILPSYYEGLPTTILEAMACKLPVVASNVSGIPEEIEEGVTGYMLSPGDIEGFYSRIVEMLENPEKMRTFGEMGRKRVIEKFTWPHIAKEVIKRYQELL